MEYVSMFIFECARAIGYIMVRLHDPNIKIDTYSIETWIPGCVCPMQVQNIIINKESPNIVEIRNTVEFIRLTKKIQV